MYNSKSSLDRLAALVVGAAPAALLVSSRAGQLVYVNPAAATLFGYDPQELEGRTTTDLIAASDRTAFASALRAARVERLCDLHGRRKSGATFPLDVQLQALAAPGEDLLLCTVCDVSEQRRTESELRDSEARFRNMADHSSVMIWVTDASGQCLYLNRLWYEFTGQTPEQALGRGWVEAVHPEDHVRNLELFRKPNARIRLEYRLRRRDGVYRWCLDACTPRFSDSGELLGYIGSVMDITERKEAETALREADQRKDEFLATLAHELRNPLAPIASAVHYLQMKQSADPNVRNARDIIERQTKQMARLVDDLLDLSRITRGRINLQKEVLSLGVAIMSALETCRPAIAAAGHELQVHLPEKPLYIYGDLARLAQVFINLLHNAAKYTPPGGRISLAVEQQAQEAVIRVRDTGVGIPPEMLQQIFEMFVQVDSSVGRSRGGLGIGLTLAQQLTRLHGGRIEAHSGGAGHGSEFSVHLPLAQGVSASLPSVASSDTLAPFEHRRVLVADDNVDAAETLKMLLETVGHEVHTAADGALACAAAAQLRPDIVLLDIGMPNMDGYEVAKRIRASSGGRNMLLVAITGWGQAHDKRRAKEAGFDHHLTKPVDPDTLLRLVAYLPPPHSTQEERPTSPT